MIPLIYVHNKEELRSQHHLNMTICEPGYEVRLDNRTNYYKTCARITLIKHQTLDLDKNEVCGFIWLDLPIFSALLPDHNIIH